MKALTVICLTLLCGLPIAHAELNGEVTTRVERGVVRIFNIRYNESTGKAGLGTGSGFILNDKGDIATNRHVVADTTKLLVTNKQGNDVRVHLATLVKEDRDRDIAIIHCNPIPGTLPNTLGIAIPPPNQSVWSVGFPGLVDDDAKFEEFLFKELFARENVGSFRDLVAFLMRSQEAQVDRVMNNNPAAIEICTPTFGNGIVARMSKRAWSQGGTPIDIIVHSAKAVHGNSGGPLINADGNVIGINTQIRGIGGFDTSNPEHETMNSE
jgi:Trypsin-like peptidase domain